MTKPLLADELVDLLRQAMTLPIDSACVVYVERSPGEVVHCTATVDDDGDVVIRPVSS